jgi:alpha-beta hydrolase superfamily lysophospholipase
LRHPENDPAAVPGVIIIAGSGQTNRNGDLTVDPGPVNTLEQIADWLSADGVASLRYDKFGSGLTGWGPYAGKVDSLGIAPYEEDSAAALRFLARQPGINDARLGVFAHSEGGLYALLLATGHSGPVPPIHAMALFEPLSVRYLNLLEIQVDEQIKAEVDTGQIAAQVGASEVTTLVQVVDHLRATGSVPSNLPDGFSSYLNSSDSKYFYQADAYNPQVLAERLPTTISVLLTCSSADDLVTCGEVNHVALGLAHAHAHLTFVHFGDVTHSLQSAVSSATPPFSPDVRAAIARFVRTSL